MWVRKHELLLLAERVKKLETAVNGLWTTIIAMDKRFSAALDWKDNGDLTMVFGGSATRQLSVAQQPTEQDSETESSDTDVKQPLSERGTGRWLLETPP